MKLVYGICSLIADPIVLKAGQFPPSSITWKGETTENHILEIAISHVIKALKGKEG